MMIAPQSDKMHPATTKDVAGRLRNWSTFYQWCSVPIAGHAIDLGIVKDALIVEFKEARHETWVKVGSGVFL